jgi:TetR/AcrR family transcriptional repressor of nem operon
MGNKGENNRQRIVTAADQLFYKRGYNQTSFRDISDKTGIPRGNFYYYFKTKEDILSAVVDARVNAFEEMMGACDSSSSDPRERLLCFTNMLSDSESNILQAGCPIGTLSSELAKDDDSYQEMSRAVFTLIRQWLATQFSALGSSNSDEKAMDLLARLQGVCVMACAFDDRKFLRRSQSDLHDWVKSQVLS